MTLVSAEPHTNIVVGIIPTEIHFLKFFRGVVVIPLCNFSTDLGILAFVDKLIECSRVLRHWCWEEEFIRYLRDQLLLYCDVLYYQVVC